MTLFDGEQEYFKDSFTEVTSNRVQRLVTHVDALHQSFKVHRTLSHGDFRLDNMFLLKVLAHSLSYSLSFWEAHRVCVHDGHSPVERFGWIAERCSRVVVGRGVDRFSDHECVGYRERPGIVLLVEPFSGIDGASRSIEMWHMESHSPLTNEMVVMVVVMMVVVVMVNAEGTSSRVVRVVR